MLGSTFSPAERETKRANGTSHTQRPKYDAISVNDGMFGSCEYEYAEECCGGAEKWRNQR
jgi:hypothetical protein